MNLQIDESVFEVFPVLETSRLILRAFTQHDVPDLFEIRSDERTMAYMDTSLHRDLDDTRIMIDEIIYSFQDATGLHWVIENKTNGRMLGYISYWKLMRDFVRAELGYALKRPYWGKGYMKEAANEVLRFGFEQLSLHSVEANINPGNQASLQLLKRLGFKKEGHLKEHFLHQGHFVDSVIFSLLEQDFEYLSL